MIENEKDKIIIELKEKNRRQEEKLQETNKRLQKTKEIKKELKSLQNEYLNFMKKVANNYINTTSNINSNNINNINMYYVINNFKNALNYDDLMNKPLTEYEKEFINKLGHTVGCYKLIENRCIKNIDLEKRPFHCVDSSRSKYALRVCNDWYIDNKGKKIIKGALPNIRNIYVLDDSVDTNAKINNMQQLLELEIKGSKKIIGQLNKTALLKNNIKSI